MLTASVLGWSWDLGSGDSGWVSCVGGRNPTVGATTAASQNLREQQLELEASIRYEPSTVTLVCAQ